MAAEKNLPIAHMFAEASQLDCADRFGRFKGGPNVVWWFLCIIANQQRTASHKEIFSFLLGERFIRRSTRLSGRFDKLVVARPERKLINQVLRFDNINRRMSWTFDPFIAQNARTRSQSV